MGNKRAAGENGEGTRYEKEEFLFLQDCIMRNSNDNNDDDKQKGKLYCLYTLKENDALFLS